MNTAGSVSVAAVTSAWTESAVTYQTMPGVSSTVTTTFTPGTSGTYVTFDITTLVQGWVTTPSGNYGIALTSASGNLLLDSKENDLTGHAASLNVTVTSMGATGATGAMGATGAAGTNGTNGANGATGATGAAGTNGANGSTGATGAAGTIGAVSQYSASTMSSYGQVVYCQASGACNTADQGSSYVYIGSGSSSAVDPSNTTYWQQIAAAGMAGTNGATGATGATGAAAGGPYSASTAYVAGSVVTYNGATYIANYGSTGVYPDSANNPQDYNTHFLNPPWTPINGIASVHYSYVQNGYTYTSNNPSLAGVPYTVTSHSLSSSNYSYYLFSPGGSGEGIGTTSSSGTSTYAPAILVLPVDCYGEITIYAPFTTTLTWKLLYANPTSNGAVASPAYGSYDPSTYQPNTPFKSIGSCQTNSTTHSCAIGGGNFAAGTQLMLEENYGASTPISFTTAFSCRALSFTD